MIHTQSVYKMQSINKLDETIALQIVKTGPRTSENPTVLDKSKCDNRGTCLLSSTSTQQIFDKSLKNLEDVNQVRIFTLGTEQNIHLIELNIR